MNMMAGTSILQAETVVFEQYSKLCDDLLSKQNSIEEANRLLLDKTAENFRQIMLKFFCESGGPKLFKDACEMRLTEKFEQHNRDLNFIFPPQEFFDTWKVKDLSDLDANRISGFENHSA